MAEVSPERASGPTMSAPRSASSQSSSDSNSSVLTKFTCASTQSQQNERNVSSPTGTSLTNFIFAEQHADRCSLDLAELINSIQTAIKAVSADLRIGNLSVNKRKAQEKVETIFTKVIQVCNPACTILTPCRRIRPRSEYDRNYAVCLQPLEGTFDGTHTPLFAGTVFGIHKVADGDASKGGIMKQRSPCIPGRQLVAAGYALYGITTTLVLSLGRGSHIFALDPATGEFLSNNDPLAVPLKGNVYNVDEGHVYEWAPEILHYIESKKAPKSGKVYRSEHFGCIVADIHSVILHGGVLMLPKIHTQTAPQLSILLCLAPLAFIVCAAGGSASNGEVAILDIFPASEPQSTQAFIGSRDDVRQLLDCLRRHRSSTMKAQENSNLLSARTLRNVSSTTGISCHREPTNRTSDSSARSRIWRPATNSSSGLPSPMFRSDLTIVPTSLPTNKKRQASAVLASTESSTLMPVAPLTTVKNNHVRLAWPAFGSIAPNKQYFMKLLEKRGS